MKKKTLLVALPLLVMAITSCGNKPSKNSDGASDASDTSSIDSSPIVSPDSSPSDSDSPIEGAFDGLIRIYFHNDLNTMSSLCVYVWTYGVSGFEVPWQASSSASVDGFEYVEIDCNAGVFKGRVASEFFFIIKKPGTWAGQSSDTVIALADFAPKEEGGKKVISVYSCQGEGNEIEVYADPSDANGPHFNSLSLASDWKNLDVDGTEGLASYELYAYDSVYYSKSEDAKKAIKPDYLIATGTDTAATFKIDLTTLSYPEGSMKGKTLGLQPNLTYIIEGKFKTAPSKTKKKAASADKLYDTSKFISEYTYSGHDLGCHYENGKTTFKVWSPISSRVRIYVYKSGTPKALEPDETKKAALSDSPLVIYPMEYSGQGVYSATVTDFNLAGYYYTYVFYYGDGKHEGPDPYATACGVNGKRSAIVDFSKTNPEGWDSVAFPAFKRPNEATAYEVHVRDFTADSTWKSKKGYANGTYNAFGESGVKYNGTPIGFDYLKNLGVNAVQFLPVFDQDNDERTYVDADGETVKPGYNWGYNPSLYNCVEGSYSSDPSKAETRIKEYKQLIADLGNAGMATIMDVVYNHVSSVSASPFTNAVPRYYFRYDENNFLIDDTGCGNTVNSDRAMVSNFIVDSVCWWAKEYKVKGFRFDLMGVIDTNTMRKLKDALYAIDPHIIAYGEGWTGASDGGSHASSPSNNYNIYAKLGNNGKGSIGAFNDCYRDGMKGNTSYGDVTPSDEGYMTHTDNTESAWKSATAIIGENKNIHGSGIATPAEQTVNYLACHDNYTLYDQMNYKIRGLAGCTTDRDDVKKAALAATANSLLGNGIAFINGGDEFFRQKLCYRSDDSETFEELVESYKYGRYNKNTESTEYSTSPWGSYDDKTYNYWVEGDGIKINDNVWLVRNSYKYGDKVNAFRWDRMLANIKWVNKVKEALAVRKDMMGKYLGLSQSDIESKVTCLGTGAIGGAFNTSYGKRIVLTSGNTGGSAGPIANDLRGSYKVVYCSTGRLDVGGNYDVGEYAGFGSDGIFETIVLEKK